MTRSGGFAFRNVEAVTDDALARAREMVGQELRIEQYNHEATFDSIRHYAFGIGDDNPLWCDEEYAAGTAYGVQLAPPLFLCSVIPSSVTPGFPGIQPLKVADKWPWHRPVRCGDRIVASARLTAVDIVQGRVGGRMAKEVGQISYRTVGGELLADVETYHLRVTRPDGGDSGLSYASQRER